MTDLMPLSNVIKVRPGTRSIRKPQNDENYLILTFIRMVKKRLENTVIVDRKFSSKLKAYVFRKYGCRKLLGWIICAIFVQCNRSVHLYYLYIQKREFGQKI